MWPGFGVSRPTLYASGEVIIWIGITRFETFEMWEKICCVCHGIGCWSSVEMTSTMYSFVISVTVIHCYKTVLCHWYLANRNCMCVATVSIQMCLSINNVSKCDSVETTNKMQPCNRIYYSTVHWRLNMFRAIPTQTWLRPVTTCVCKPEAANTVRAPDDERCTARNMLSL